MTNGEKIKEIFPNGVLTSINNSYYWGDDILVSKDFWNAEYKEPTDDLSSELESGATKNDLGVDAISREDALMCLTGKFENREYELSELINIFSKRIKALSSVTPIRPKGKWVQQIEEDVDGELLLYWECSKCGRIVGHNMADIKNVINDYPFCHCGADMRGEEE